MSKKLAAKAGLIQIPGISGLGVTNSSDEGAKPKTAPGSMMQFMHSQSAAIQEAESLKGRLKEFEGSLPMRLLDPKTIRPSKWANRHAATYSNKAFHQLKDEISSAGRNVQPIKVRPIQMGVGPSNSQQENNAQFEIVYGHRRHRACLELELPVAAIVDAVSEQDLFVEMERENRSRKDLSAWEQGRMYANALDIGLYQSNRKLADAIGRDLGDVGKALSLARLPKEVVEAFQSPLDLQYRWAKPLCDAQQANPDLLLTRARAIKKQAGKLSAREIFERLTQAEKGPVLTPKSTSIERSGVRLATLQADSQGRLILKIERDALPTERQEEFARIVEAFLSK